MTKTDVQLFNGWHRDIVVNTRKPVIFGFCAIAIALGAAGAWAFTAPLAGAVVAPGIVVAIGQNKIVQHLEGGIVDSILVKEGDLVVAGQPVIRLNRTAAESNLQRLVEQYDAMRIIEARFLAEREGDGAIALPKDILEKRTLPEVMKVIEGQYAEFRARRDSLASSVTVLAKEIAATQEVIVGLRAQKVSADEQLRLIKEELATVQGLFDQKLALKSQVLALERAAAQLIGTQGDTVARIAQAHQSIAEIESRILDAKNNWLEKATSQLRDIQIQIADLEERIKAARDIADREVVKAPATGIVVKLFKNTQGGVIAPAQTVLELLPTDVDLEIEARIRPDDIASIKAGSTAQLRLTAYHKRSTPTLMGFVEYISADRLTDPTTQQTYYATRIRLSNENPKGKEYPTISAGMPVEVFIHTGERTFIEYLLGPLNDIFMRAFRES